MRHGKKTKKLSRLKSHRDAMLSNMATSLFMHQRVKTTQSKAKALRPLAEKLITWAKKKDLNAYRQVYRIIKDRKIIKKLFEEIAPEFSKRSGGYTRVLKLGQRRGDAASVALIELVVKKSVPEKTKEKKEKTGKKESVAKEKKLAKKAAAETKEKEETK